jgi:hypothetical protein
MFFNSKLETNQTIVLFQEYMSLSSQTKSKFKAKLFNKCLRNQTTSDYEMFHDLNFGLVLCSCVLYLFICFVTKKKLFLFLETETRQS